MKLKKKKVLLIKILAILCIISIVGIFDYWLWGPRLNQGIKPVQNDSFQNKAIISEEQKTKITSDQTTAVNSDSQLKIKNWKSEINLDVPFISQAPFANWDNLHNEACEEAALIMAKYWINGEKLTKEKAEEEILNSVTWQTKNWGGHYDLPVEKIVELGQKYFGLEKIYFLYNITLDDIKEELSKNNLVIVPAAGRLLKNPYYRQPGPIYHMLVVRGYDQKWIITNDPGTKRGENFKYTYQNFFDSIYNWPYGPPDFGQNLSKDEKAVEILRGQKVMIVIEK